MSDLPVLNDEYLENHIYFIRGEKVMLDFDLAMLYNVETRVLKQQVKRNMDRFPSDFMIELTKTEWQEVITNCDNLQNRKFSPALPFAFTEQGVSMLSTVLRSERAIKVNIAIMRAFVQIRKLSSSIIGLESKIDRLEEKYDKQFKIVFDVIRKLIHEETKPRKRIGYNSNNEDMD